MNIDRNLSEIRAEVLLNYLYPEMEEQWTAHYDGNFYRNYSGDTMLAEETTGEVRLSRDGLLRLLPQGLISRDEDLRGEDVAEKYEELKRRRHLLDEAFLPFDTFVFHKRIAIERQVSELLEGKISYLLKTYFGFDLEAEKNPLVREAAVLLPFISTYKGDLGFVASLLATLTGQEVEMGTGRYSGRDTTESWLPQVRYDIIVPNLTAAEYRERREEMEPLVAFVKEWLIPFDVHCEVHIKAGILETRQQASDGHGFTRMVLEYNTTLNVED